MRFCDQQYYMHKNALDVCIQVIKVNFRGPNYTRMKAEYINLGYTGNPARIVRLNNFVVKKEEYENWVWLKEEEINIPRTKPGLPK